MEAEVSNTADHDTVGNSSSTKEYDVYEFYNDLGELTRVSANSLSQHRYTSHLNTSKLAGMTVRVNTATRTTTSTVVTTSKTFHARKKLTRWPISCKMGPSGLNGGWADWNSFHPGILQKLQLSKWVHAMQIIAPVGCEALTDNDMT